MTTRPSPNHDAREATVDMLILHYTGMRTAAEAIQRLCDPMPPTLHPVSAHYVVDEDGGVTALVPEARRAWHAGVSYWRGARALNGRSIGIEIVNPGHEFGYCDFPPAQMAAVRTLCLDVLARHAIPAWHVLAHSDVAPDRKQDPGERFGWQALARDGIGVWPEHGAAVQGCVADVSDALRRIGYDPTDTALAVRAFQRHWRPESVTGVADPGTCGRLFELARLAEENIAYSLRSR